MNRPNFLSDRHLDVLAGMDEARRGNMISAVADILENCPVLDARQAQQVLIYWNSRTQSEKLRVPLAV